MSVPHLIYAGWSFRLCQQRGLVHLPGGERLKAINMVGPQKLSRVDRVRYLSRDEAGRACGLLPAPGMASKVVDIWGPRWVSGSKEESRRHCRARAKD